MTSLQPISVKFINSNAEIWQNPIFCYSDTISTLQTKDVWEMKPTVSTCDSQSTKPYQYQFLHRTTTEQELTGVTTTRVTVLKGKRCEPFLIWGLLLPLQALWKAISCLLCWAWWSHFQDNAVAASCICGLWPKCPVKLPAGCLTRRSHAEGVHGSLSC